MKKSKVAQERSDVTLQVSPVAEGNVPTYAETKVMRPNTQLSGGLAPASLGTQRETSPLVLTVSDIFNFIGLFLNGEVKRKRQMCAQLEFGPQPSQSAGKRKQSLGSAPALTFTKIKCPHACLFSLTPAK